MFQSPLKTVTEKLKPTQSKSGISSLKFERASDFKKFIGFIKTETEELEKIKLPTTTEIKPKSKSGGLLGLLGLGLLGGLGAAFGDDGESNERTGSEGGTANEFNNEVLLTKNIRKVQKNLGSSKFIGGKKRFKTTKKLFERKLKGINLKSLKQKLKGLQNDLKEAKIRRADNLKSGNTSALFLDDAIIANFKDEIKSLKNEIKIFEKTGLTKKLKFDFNNLEAFRSIIDESKLNTQEGLRNKILLDKRISIDPEFKDLVDEISKLDPLMFDVPEGSTLASKIFGRETGIKLESKMFRVRDFLDETFTGIGKTTKPLRKFFTPAAKNLGKTKIPFTGIKLTSLSKLGKGIFLPLDLINLGVAFDDLGLVDFSDGILKPKVGRDNIVTSVYDMFTVFYNEGVELLGFDDAHKRLKISKPKDREISGSIIPFTNIGAYTINPRKIVDAYNEEILEAREAKKLRDAFKMTFDNSMLNNPNIQFPKSNVFSIQKPDGAEFAVPYEYSEGLYDFTMPLKIKLNKQ